jgi:iron-regulated transporter 1
MTSADTLPSMGSQPPPQSQTCDSPSQLTPSNALLYRLNTSHTLSTWNSRTFEFGAVIFLAAIFPGTLFYASCYALFRSLSAGLLGSWVGSLVDRHNRLEVVRSSIVWQRLSVASSCVVLVAMLQTQAIGGFITYGLFVISIILACIEKLAYVANTVAVERDWIIVVSDSLKVERQQLNSVMRRIDLICKLIAPVGIGLLDGYSTQIAICVVFAQNALSVGVEYWAIAQVYNAVPELNDQPQHEIHHLNQQESESSTPTTPPTTQQSLLAPYIAYLQNPAFLASFALSLLYLTVLSFASQMTTYLLTLGFTSTHISLMRLVSVLLELSATVAAPYLMSRIGPIRSGLWFINEQLISIALAIGLFLMYIEHPRLAGLTLVSGIALSRLGLWGFDLSVQYLVQDAAPASERGSFSAIEMSVQNIFELLSFATTMVFYRPEDFKIPIYISAAAIAGSAACFAGYVRKQRGHLLHTDKCMKRVGRMGKGRGKYRVLPTIEEEGEGVEMDDRAGR